MTLKSSIVQNLVSIKEVNQLLKVNKIKSVYIVLEFSLIKFLVNSKYYEK